MMRNGQEERVSLSRELDGLDEDDKKRISFLVAMCAPADDLQGGLWCSTLLRQLMRLLRLPEQHAAVVTPLTSSASACRDEEAFRVDLPSAQLHCVLRDLMTLVALSCGYDARTRGLFRQLARALEVEWIALNLVESCIAHAVYGRASGLLLGKKSTKDKWRNFKIGAAAVGGGTLLAVTGGLAAPALAAGIAATGTLLGASTAAAALSGFATTTFVGGLFGTAGAGLLGHKMDRRTKEVKEFRFVPGVKETHEMSVVICIPGLLGDERDYYRAWGVSEVNASSTEPGWQDIGESLERSRDDFEAIDALICAALTEEGEGGDSHPCSRMDKAQQKIRQWRRASKCDDAASSGLPCSADGASSPSLFEAALSEHVSSQDASSPIVLGEGGELPSREIQEEHETDANELSAQTGESREWHWRTVAPYTDQFILRWETDLLLELGGTVQTLVRDASKQAAQEMLKYSALGAVMAAVAIPVSIMSIANMIDTDWFIGCKRAKIAGIMLAEVLLNREHGGRPVTLIGCSLGGRVLLACLEEMSRRHEMWEQKEAMGREGIACSPADFREAKCAAGIVDAAILLGAPVDTDPELWSRARRIVHGRFVNGFSSRDWVLGLIYRAKKLRIHAAGIEPINCPGVENVDVSAFVRNQFDYTTCLPDILEYVGVY